jgi:hypothetical protein
VGTHIHLFVEYRISDGGYFSLTRGGFILARNYDAFGALAGVRGDIQPLIAPRGFPEDASREAQRAYYHRISDETAYHDGFWFLEKPEHARDPVARGLSHTKSWRNVELVSDPDAHTASWLDGPELDSSLATPSVNADLSEDYRIVIAALQRLAASDARAVFWFTD